MKLSLVFELLLIFVLLAFAASKSVKKHKNNQKGIQNRIDKPKQEDSGINKYCKCSESLCNCCRDFNVPLISVNGPGCASLMYLLGDRMSVSLSFGKRVITNRTLSGRKPSPVCMPLPGGVSKFCGRIYNIGRSGEDFRACLGLELQSKSTVEAAVRVSCFKFGSRGVTSEPADPLPLVPKDEDDDDEDDDDDDDDDDFGLDDDDDDDGLISEAENDVEGADYTGFSLLSEDILGDLFGSSSKKKPNSDNKNKKKQAPAASTTTTTRRPRPSRRPTRRPARTTTARTTTVRVRPTTPRPSLGRPTRRSTRRPSRRTTTTTTTPTTITVAEVASSESVTSLPISVPINDIQPTTPKSFVSTNEEMLEPVVIMTQKPYSVIPIITTPKISTENIEDPGLQLSLAHITGQLSDMSVTNIISTSTDSAPYTTKDMIAFEKIDTVTSKNPTTYINKDKGKSKVRDDIIQIVDSLDSSSSESVNPSGARSQLPLEGSETVSGDYYDGLSLAKKKSKKNRKNKNNDYDDLLGLTSIYESISHALGLNKGKKRNNRQKNNVNDERKNTGNDYDILGLDAWSETLGLTETSNKKNNRRRQNKMMRGDWNK